MRRFFVFAAALAASLAGIYAAEPGPGAASIPLGALPPAVQRGIQEQLGNGALGEIEREEEGGDVTYTVDITRNGRGRTYELNEQGEVMSVTVFLPETPLAVQRAVQAQIGIGRGVVVGIEKAFENGAVSFDVEWQTKEGASRNFTVSETGKLESVQVAIEETPAVVRATIERELGKGQLLEVTKSFEEDGVYYEAEVTRDGKDRDFSVAEDGRLESRQVFLSEVPPPARKTILQTVGNGKIVRLDRPIENKKGGNPIEVEATKDGKPFNFRVGPKGKLLGPEE